MKVLRFLGVIAMICGFTGLAGATPVNFHMHVLDPDTYPTLPILTTPFPIVFTVCIAGELPKGDTGDGCFAGHNETGQDWTNLQMTFTNGPEMGSATPDCTLAPSENLFTNANCSLSPDGSTYLFSFYDGKGIADGAFFFITEEGLDPSAFGTGSGSVLTPEPSSILLLSTGLILFGLLFKMDRRRALHLSLLS